MSTFRKKVQATTNGARPATAGLTAGPRGAAGSQPRPKALPVTAHRLFPAFATLWFAALFGLGSLAISSEALGVLVTMIGLPALVPAAAPPLGFTAHLLVAFGLGTVGAALGLVLALRLRPQVQDSGTGTGTGTNDGANAAWSMKAAAPFAQPDADETYKVRARDAHPDAPPRRPLVLTEAFHAPLVQAPAAPLDAPEAPLLRRKPGKLASDDMGEAGQSSGPWIAEYAPGGAGAVQPLDLAALDLTDPVRGDSFAPAAHVADEAAPVVGADVMPQAEAKPDAEAETETETEAESETQAGNMPAVPVLIAATPQLPVSPAAMLPAGSAAGLSTAFADRAAGGWSPVAGVPIESLGLVQLIERLALAMADRKTADLADPASAAADMPPAAAASAAAPSFAPGPFSAPPAPETPAPETPAPQTFAQPAMGADGPVPVSARETILQRLEAVATATAQGADAATPPFSRPAATPAAATPAAATPAAATPAAVFAAPVAQAAPDGPAVPFETDVALRAALATLQRMSARG